MERIKKIEELKLYRDCLEKQKTIVEHKNKVIGPCLGKSSSRTFISSKNGVQIKKYASNPRDIIKATAKTMTISSWIDNM